MQAGDGGGDPRHSSPACVSSPYRQPPPQKKTKDRSLGPACPLGSLGAELSEARCSALLGAAEDVQPELEGTLGPHLPQSALSRSPLVSSILEVWLSSEATEFIRILGPLVGDP